MRPTRDEDKPILQWPRPCRECMVTGGLREVAWHHLGMTGALTVSVMACACDCELGKVKAERARDEGGRRILGTVREVWDRLARLREHVELFVDPTVAQRSAVPIPPTSSEAIKWVKATLYGQGAA